jgi:hypothetical protein
LILLDYDAYRQAFFVEPGLEEQYNFVGQLGAALYFHEFEQASDYYQQVLGLPGFIEAGGTGHAPSDQLMYEKIRSCPVMDPFGTMLMIFSPF